MLASVIKQPKNQIMVVVMVCLLGLPIFSHAASDTLTIYSARKEALILPLLKRFKKDTGINYRLTTGKADGLLKRLEIEGKHTPADLFITVDAGRLQRAKDAGVLQVINNQKLFDTIPAHLRDQENYWVGLSQRARTLIYDKTRVKASDLTTYEAMTDPKWRQRLCIRSSNNIYNQSLVAALIDAHGEKKTEAWARGLVENFARRPKGGDTDQLKAVKSGQCDVALVNTYYFGRLTNSKSAKKRAIVENLAVFWPNQGDGERGVHVNVSGAGITKYSKNKAAAEKLLEYMVNNESQAWYAEVNNEYPVVDGVAITSTLMKLGEFKADKINLTVLGKNNPAAVKVMDRAGWR